MLWKDVIGYEEFFSVSNTGEVWSKRTNKLLKQTISPNGYYVISTRIGGRSGKCIMFRVHRLVAEAFLSEPEEYMHEWAKKSKYGCVQVNHIDCNKLNNNLYNLEWCTAEENLSHARDNGRFPENKFSICAEELAMVKFVSENVVDGTKLGYRHFARLFNTCRQSLKSKVLFYRENMNQLD